MQNLKFYSQTIMPICGSFVFILLFCLHSLSFGQTVPTFIDWVKPSQTYMQVRVGQNGIYRIPASMIEASFGNLQSLNPAGFQIFRRGKELAIFVRAGSDNILNGDDYIDFAAKMNDASIEDEMYQKPISARNQYRTIYDDTAHYFLTHTPTLDGKRVVNNGLNNNSSVAFETYHWRMSGFFPRLQYSYGKGLRANLTYSSYISAGEGWTGNAYSAGFGEAAGSQTSWSYVPLKNISNLFLGGPRPELELLQVGRRSLSHKVDVLVGNSLQLLDTFRFDGLGAYLFKKEFDPALIETGALNVWPTPRGSTNVAVAYATVRYPATFQLPPGNGPLEFELAVNTQNYSRLRFDNVQIQPELYDVSDPLNPVKIGVGLVNGLQIAGVENTAEARKMLLQEEPFVVDPSIGKKVSFQNILPSNFNYLIVSHPKLRQPIQGLDAVKAYADYRASAEGGLYKVLLLEIDEVYQRFGYGDRNPLALRNLCGYFVENNVDVKGLFLLGKGLGVHNRLNPSYLTFNYIPTFGTPASDIAITVGLGEEGKTMAIPVGRLAALSPQQVLNYLNKVKETEAFQYDDLWKKNVFHISGGLNKLEQNTFSYIMNNELKPKVSGKYMGAKVGTYNKSSSQTVEYVDIRSVVNSGISLLTLFGHSSRTSPDVEIGNASDPTQGYNNTGRYPVVVVNGCFTGNVYELSGSLSEDWIFTPNKGAIVFIGATDEGLSAILKRNMNDFYSKAFQDSLLFGETIGKIQKETMKKFLSTLSNEPQLDSAFIHQFAIHGDPAIRIFSASKPDYKTSNAEVFFVTPSPTATSPNLRLAVIASNFGRYNGDSLKIRINRRFADGSSNDFIYLVKPISYLDTFYFDLPQDQGFNYSGLNRFEVTLDFLGEVQEMNEMNNSGFFEYFLPASGILPLFPKEYSIVPSRNVKMTVQATDFLAPGRRYVFQIDTSARFNSPLFAQSPEILAGNLCSWNYLLPIDRDSTVFFWRVKFADKVNPSDTTWFNMSFEYIKNSGPGWAQSNFYQFRKSYDIGLRKNFVTRRWEFPSVSTEVNISVSGGSKQGPKQYSLTIDGIQVLKGAIGSSDCYIGYPRICAITLDKCSLKPRFWNYYNDPIAYYYTGCGRLPFSVNVFETVFGNTFRVFFQNYINNFVQEGEYVILIPMDSVNMDTLRKYVNPVLGQIGVDVSQLAGLQNGNPFIIFGQKSSSPIPGQATLILPQNNGTPANRQILTYNRSLSASCGSGMVYSTRIGPATAWRKIHRKFSVPETPQSDKAYLQLHGIDINGKDSLLVPEINQFPYDISNLNAAQFPYLQLSAVLKDTSAFTPSTILRWMVNYEPVPEGILNTTLIPSSEYLVSEKEEGDSLGFRFAFTNISNKRFQDSLNVRFRLNGQNYLEKQLAKLEPDSTVYFSIPKFSTIGKTGTNNILAFVNPRIQPEEYYENNALNIPFKVKADRMQPILDVTFDRVKIMNGDFVSTQPEIEILLKDENKFLLKSDTRGMTMILTKPCQSCPPESIPLDSTNARVKVYPAGADNLFRIVYKPEKLVDGQYRLAVQGADVKGNAAGSQLFQVDFNVLDKNTITNFFPYPNPFSTSCQWVFTLTGEEPEDFKIQIMTVTGKVVREIFKSEIGPIRLGNNVSSYRWDATDSYGDRLANGVYLYRVVMKGGQDFSMRETAGDFTFKKGFGKLYIIR